MFVNKQITGDRSRSVNGFFVSKRMVGVSGGRTVRRRLGAPRADGGAHVTVPTHMEITSWGIPCVGVFWWAIGFTKRSDAGSRSITLAPLGSNVQGAARGYCRHTRKHVARPQVPSQPEHFTLGDASVGVEAFRLSDKVWVQ